MFGHRVTQLLFVLAILVVITLCIIPAQAVFSDGASNIKLVGQIPISTIENLVYNNTLYLQNGYSVRVYDLDPTGVNQYYMKYSDETDVIKNRYSTKYRINNNTLYIAGSSTSIFDISGDYRLHPNLLNGSAGIPSDDIAFDGDTAFFVRGSTIRTVDVSNPSTPVVLATKTGLSSISRLAYDPVNKRIFGAGYGYSYFTIINASDPLNLVQTYKKDVENSIYGIAYKNNTLYAPIYRTTFRAFNIVNDTYTNGVYWSTAHFFEGGATGPVDVEIVGNYMYTDERYGYFSIWNVSQPYPVFLYKNGDTGSSSNFGYAEEISTDGTTVVISTNKLGAYVYNATNKHRTRYKTQLPVPAQPTSLATQTVGSIDVLSMCGYDGGCWYYNITDPEDPVYGFDYAEPMKGWNYRPAARISDENGRGHTWFGNYTFSKLGSNGLGFWTINMTGVFETEGYWAPYGTSTTHTAPGYNDLSVSYMLFNETRAYLGSRSGGKYLIYNFTRKDTRELPYIKSWNIPEWYDLYWYHDYNHILALGKSKIQVYNNLSNDNPTLEYQFNFTKPMDSSYGAFYWYDDTSDMVYQATNNGDDHRVYGIDVSDPANIYITGDVKLPTGQIWSVRSNGTDVFIGGTFNGPNTGSIVMASFADKANPVVIDHANSRNSESPEVTMRYYKGYLYVGNWGGSGITAWKITPSSGAPQKPQQTIGSQNPQSEQHSYSSGTRNDVLTDISTPATSLSVLIIIGTVGLCLMVLRK